MSGNTGNGFSMKKTEKEMKKKVLKKKKTNFDLIYFYTWNNVSKKLALFFILMIFIIKMFNRNDCSNFYLILICILRANLKF